MKPVTTADRLRADIKELGLRIDQLQNETLKAENATLGAIRTRFDSIEARLAALEDAVTMPQPEPAPAKPAKPVPPPGYVTVKTMCSEADLSYDTEASNMLRHYARHFCTAMRLEVWRRPDTGKGYDHFPREAANYAIDRVKQERAGELPTTRTADALFTQPHVNGASQ